VRCHRMSNENIFTCIDSCFSWVLKSKTKLVLCKYFWAEYTFTSMTRINFHDWFTILQWWRIQNPQGHYLVTGNHISTLFCSTSKKCTHRWQLRRVTWILHFDHLYQKMNCTHRIHFVVALSYFNFHVTIRQN